MEKPEDAFLKQLKNEMALTLKSVIRVASEAGKVKGRKLKRKMRVKDPETKQAICQICGNNGRTCVRINKEKIGKNLDEYVEAALCQGWQAMSVEFNEEILRPILETVNSRGFGKAIKMLEIKGDAYKRKIEQALID